MVTVFGWGRESSTSAYAVSHSKSNPFVQAAKVWMNPDSDTASVSEWTFTYATELNGWQLASNLTGTILNDALVLNIKGGDPYLTSPYGLNLNTENYRYLTVTMKNRTSDTEGRVSWRTNSETSYAASKYASFMLAPKDSIYREYKIDLGANTKWYGRIAEIRLDPVENITSGKVEITSVKFTNEVTDVQEESSEKIPAEFCLEQNYPNPFNPVTIIKFQIPESMGGNVVLKVYDLLGREVATLVNEEKAPGIYNVEFNASSLSSGVYFYKLSVNSFSEIKKMMLLK